MKKTAQFPRPAFDKTGSMYCVYRWSDTRATAQPSYSPV